MTSVLILFSILAVALLIYGLATRVDRGYLHKVKHWDRSKLPLIVVLDTDLGSIEPKISELLYSAIDYWNSALGFELFRHLTDYATGTNSYGIVPVLAIEELSEKPSKSSIAYAKLYTGPGTEIHSASVYVDLEKFYETDEDYLTRIFSHELGHVLGLAHDDFTYSVMFRRLIREDPQVTSKDIELLQKSYGPINDTR